MVTNNPEVKKLQIESFEKSAMHLNKIIRGIQEVGMAMRMVPLAATFRKMTRLVRDLSIKAGKKIELEIIGDETEVDKTIIEEISDPLVHIIRNSADHGLETPEERKAAGKPETGLIRLEAKNSVGEVFIIIQDDGRGLNTEKILKKAIERGLADKDKNYKDEDIWKFIFEPGFSTADKVSNISGRGVGMDVVRRNIEKLRGKIDIRSKPGEGSIMIIRIPLTLAIIDGMVVRVGKNFYTIPITSVVEAFQPQKGQITVSPDGQELARVRESLYPIIRLHSFYNVSSDYTELNNGILVIVENDSKHFCLFVDELVGQQQIVVKNLSTYIGAVRGVSGCAILGDGDISMILDIANMVS